MSTIKVSNLQNASAASPAITLAADGSATANLSSVNGGPIAGTRNRIINGDMRIDQRNAGASLSVANTGLYSVDRWRVSNSVSTVTVQQSSSVVPTDFKNSLGLTVSTTDSTGSHAVVQFVEGFNFSDFNWGSANAKTVTLSFWVRSSLVGTYGVGFQNSAQNRSYVATYTINAANTWEYKTITVTGDTTGTWIGSANGIGLSLEFDLGSASSYNQAAGSWGTGANARRTSGCVNWANTSGATFYLTGVQLEPGTVATPFERRSYGAELALCQRYYLIQNNTTSQPKTAIGWCFSTTRADIITAIPVTMRIAPSLTVTATASDYAIAVTNSAIACSAVPVLLTSTPYSAHIQYTVSSGLTAGQAVASYFNTTSGYLGFSSEL